MGTEEITSLGTPLSYDDFQDSAFSDYDESLNISDNLHFEYYYSVYCGHCKAIKQNVLHFFEDLTETEYYMIDTSKATGEPIIESFVGVPVLYLVYNNQVVAEYVGSLQIPAFIEAYNNGEIDLSIFE